MGDRADARPRRRGGRGGGAEARRALRGKSAIKQLPTLMRRIPSYQALSEEGLVLIEENAEAVLEEIGIEFRDDAEALELWRGAGADGERVRLPRGLCRRLIASAPAEFIQHARNPERNVAIGGDNTVFAPVFGPPFVRDLDRGRRYGTIEDFRNFVKLAYLSPALHHSGGTVCGPVCEPVDVPVNKHHLDMVYEPHRPFRQSVHGLGDPSRTGRRHGGDGAPRLRRRARRAQLRHLEPDQRRLADGLRCHHAGGA